MLANKIPRMLFVVFVVGLFLAIQMHHAITGNAAQQLPPPTNLRITTSDASHIRIDWDYDGPEDGVQVGIYEQLPTLPSNNPRYSEGVFDNPNGTHSDQRNGTHPA
jgi:hypothetical protein